MNFIAKSQILIIVLSQVICLTLLCTGCTKKQPTDNSRRTDSTINQTTSLLAALPDNDQPPAKGATFANQAPKEALVNYFFSDNGRSVAYSVCNPGYSYVSFNGKPGKVYGLDVVNPVVLSADGGRYAYGAQVAVDKFRMVVDGDEGAVFTQLRDFQFSSDGKHTAYFALKDGKWGLVVDSIWYDGKSEQFGKFLFSGDSERIAYIDTLDAHYAGRLVVMNLKSREQVTVFQAGVQSMVANADMTRIAAVVSSAGKQSVVSFSFANPGDMKRGADYDAINNLAFAVNGTSVVYAVEKSGVKYMVFNDNEENMSGVNLKEPPVVRPDLKVVAALCESKDSKVYLREFFRADTKVGRRYDAATGLTYNSEGVPVFAAAMRAKNAWFIVVGGKEGPLFDRVVTPKFSPDGRYVVYRARKDGKRFVVVADKSGATIRIHPKYEQVFDVNFTPDGKSIAYGVKDGLKLVWVVESLE